MSVWLCCPSARPVAEVNARMQKWRDMGYKIALWRDTTTGEYPECDRLIISSQWPGVYVAWNTLVANVFRTQPDCDWVVCAGDDTDPDPTKRADDIAAECSHLFGAQQMRFVQSVRFLEGGAQEDTPPTYHSTFGVMQPTGDRWGEDEAMARHMWPDAPAYIDRICGSPWIGREFARRVNGGRGPWWPEYRHMHGDEELQAVAKSLGVLWQRPDLTHHHDHCRRDGVARTPEFLVEAYGPEHWAKYSKLFAERKAAGFPGHEVIA